MNIKRNIIVLLVALLGIMTFAGCTKKANGPELNPNANTIGTKLLNAFVEEAGNSQDAEVIATKLSENNLLADIGMVSIEVEPGYLNGFDAEINGFTKGYMFAPMIGSIPFVGYVFESENPDALIEVLKASANQNWNICTQADETVVEKSGNLVYFVMAPNSFD